MLADSSTGDELRVRRAVVLRCRRMRACVIAARMRAVGPRRTTTVIGCLIAVSVGPKVGRSRPRTSASPTTRGVGRLEPRSAIFGLARVRCSTSSGGRSRPALVPLADAPARIISTIGSNRVGASRRGPNSTVEGQSIDDHQPADAASGCALANISAISPPIEWPMTAGFRSCWRQPAGELVDDAGSRIVERCGAAERLPAKPLTWTRISLWSLPIFGRDAVPDGSRRGEAGISTTGVPCRHCGS